MQLYFAASFSARASMRDHRKLAESYGHKVTSSWIDIPDSFPTMAERMECEKRQAALQDIEDIDAAEALIFFADGGTTAGGKYVELGYAIKRGMQIYLIGERTSVFHFHGSIEPVPNVEAVFRYLYRQDQNR